MNKTDLSAAVAAALSVPNTQGAVAVNAVFDIISEALADGDSVNITGFGKFEAVQSKARTGRNPKTGEPVDIPAKNAIKFRPGKGLKEQVSD